jgi:hypothetical protein
MGKASDWDIDLRFGQEGETYVNNLLTNIETVEVKRDKRWIETGNLFIETQCWSDKQQQWYDSGINASKASHWSFVLEDLVVIIPLNKLKETVQNYGRPIEMNRSEYSTKGYLITVENIFSRINDKRGG